MIRNSKGQRKAAFTRRQTTKEVTYSWHRRLDTLCRLIIINGVVSRSFYSSANTSNLISERNWSSIAYRLQLDQEFVIIYISFCVNPVRGWHKIRKSKNLPL